MGRAVHDVSFIVSVSKATVTACPCGCKISRR